MNAAESFGRDADVYDRSRRQLIPCFDDFYRIAIEQSRLVSMAEPRILDLGAGTGLLSQFLLDAFPLASITLVDAAPEMLEKARARFSGPARVTFVAQDYSAASIEPGFDIIASALSIHHLHDAEKQALFARVHGALNPGGVFVNADQVLGTTPAVDQRNHGVWLDGARRLGATDSDIAAAQERMTHDRPATLDEQLCWLREAGFRDVDCAYKHYFFAVYGGRA